MDSMGWGRVDGEDRVGGEGQGGRGGQGGQGQGVEDGSHTMALTSGRVYRRSSRPALPCPAPARPAPPRSAPPRPAPHSFPSATVSWFRSVQGTLDSHGGVTESI